MTGTIAATRRRTQQLKLIWGECEMNGLDQVVVFMWFLPAVLFIVMPLCVGVVWLPISLFLKLLQREAVHDRAVETVGEEAG